MDKSGAIHESAGRKQDCEGVNDKMVKQKIIDNSFKLLLKMGTNLIGRYLFNKPFSSFLWTGTTYTIFQKPEIFFSSTAISNINLSGKAIN